MAHFSNADLAQAISNLIAADVSIKTEFQAWLAGSVGGGPNTDGKYPLTDYQDNTVLTTCPAQMAEDVASEVTGAAGHATDAETAQTAAELAETHAETAEVNAETAETSAVTAKNTAVTAKNDAESARTTAIAQAAAALASANNASTSETNASSSETAAQTAETYAEAWANTAEDTLVANPPGDGATEYSALHWAAKAATFNPDLFYLRTALDGGQLDNRYYTETELDTTFGNYTLTSGLSISNWNTAYGWGDHAGVYELIDAAIVKSDEAEVIAGQWSFNAHLWMEVNAKHLQGKTVAGARKRLVGIGSDDKLYFNTDTIANVIANGAWKLTGNIGFYNTAPIAKQTGVVVSAAGVHAALVNLGLIT